jgi:predicted regulator of Ras-like GTPase activity (Roadblock/LC7/MglB family)
MSINTILESFLEETKSEDIIVIDARGNTVAAVHIKQEAAVSAMSGAIIAMCDKFLDDLEKGLLKQMYLKTTIGIIVINKININNSVIVYSKNAGNLGLYLHNVEELASKLHIALIS